MHFISGNSVNRGKQNSFLFHLILKILSCIFMSTRLNYCTVWGKPIPLYFRIIQTIKDTRKIVEIKKVETYGPYKVQYMGINLPLEVRKKLKLIPGDWAVWIIDDEGQCILKKATIKIEP